MQNLDLTNLDQTNLRKWVFTERTPEEACSLDMLNYKVSGRQESGNWRDFRDTTTIWKLRVSSSGCLLLIFLSPCWLCFSQVAKTLMVLQLEKKDHHPFKGKKKKEIPVKSSDWLDSWPGFTWLVRLDHVSTSESEPCDEQPASNHRAGSSGWKGSLKRKGSCVPKKGEVWGVTLHARPPHGKKGLLVLGKERGLTHFFPHTLWNQPNCSYVVVDKASCSAQVWPLHFVHNLDPLVPGGQHTRLTALAGALSCWRFYT